MRDFIYGKAIGLYWYIPVLIFLYLVTPLLDYLMSIKKFGNWIIFFIALLPLVVSRIQMAFEYILSLETMVFFTGSYAFGMLVGSNIDSAIQQIQKLKLLIWGIAILSSAVILYLLLEDINTEGLISIQQTFFYIQKTALTCGFLLVFFQLGERQPRWMHIFARDSFAIYFLHGFFAFGGAGLFLFIIQREFIWPFNIIIGSILIFTFSVAGSMTVVWIFRKIFGKNSRLFIGS